MQRDDEDDVWRAIVENYGDRPEVDDPPPPPADEEEHVVALDAAWAAPDAIDEDAASVADPDRFVPPTPPPLPRPPRDRLLAWAGVFGSPAVLLICLVAGISLPRLVSYALVVAFVGGFLYLVWRMPRGPRDPWDDGAQV